MAGKNTLEILVKAIDKATPVLRGVGQAVGGMATGAKYALTGIGLAAGAALTGVTALGAGLTKLAVDAAPLQGIQAAFEGITGGGEQMLAQLREQSAYMVTDRDLMKSYNLAAQLVGKQFADNLPTAMRYLTKVAAATGQSMDYMMDSLVRGVGRVSPLILDNLGVQVDLTEALEKQAAALGKDAEQLSKAEQQAAVMNEVMEQLARNTEKMPEVTGSASAGLGALSAALANAKDEIGTAFMPALDAVLTLFAELRPVFQQAVTWVADLVRGWASGFATLIADAATWGANIVESLASGISGSNAIIVALRNVAQTITSWLAPGSPPKLLPDLPDWGAGALDAWLSGWTGNTLLWSGLAQNLRANLRPFLERIDLGKGIDEGALRDVFQADAPTMRRYLKAYEGVGRAVAELANAREELGEAEESGDEEAIEAAKGRVKAAEDAEYSARRAFNAEERRLEMRISAEAQIARAVTETAQVQAKAAADSATMAEEAKRRAIEQAHLQYRLAVAGTPAGQIPIWEEQLAKAEEGSAEYWNIMTRLVELRRAAAKEAGAAGAAAGISYAGTLKEGVTEGNEAAAQDVEKIDWAGIGSAIGGALLEGIKTALGEAALWIGEKVNAWAQDPATMEAVTKGGNAIGALIGAGIRALFGLPAEVVATATSLETHLQQVALQIGSAAWSLGMQLGDSIIFGMAASFVPGATAAEMEAAWEAGFTGAVLGIGTKVGSAEAAANLAQRLLEVSQSPDVSMAARDVAETQAGYLIEKFDLVLKDGLVSPTAEGIEKLKEEQMVIDAALAAGEAAGDKYAEGFLQSTWDSLKNSNLGRNVAAALGLLNGPAPSPARPGEIRAKEDRVAGYAAGGIVTRPTLAMIGERGPEAVVPLGRLGTTYQYNLGGIHIDARGADAHEVERGVLRGLRAAGIPVAP